MTQPLHPGGDSGYLRIATEEAFVTPELIQIYLDMVDKGSYDDPGFRSEWGFYGKATAQRPRFVLESLQDLGDKRLADMDAAGVDRQILSLTCPGVQVLGTDLAKAQAVLANDQLAEACRRHPDRFSGLTAVAPQDPKHAAAEIERGKSTLGLNGVIINSHTNGEYLDDPKFWDIFEAAQALDTPIYLHPTTPPTTMIKPMRGAAGGRVRLRGPGHAGDQGRDQQKGDRKGRARASGDGGPPRAGGMHGQLPDGAHAEHASRGAPLLEPWALSFARLMSASPRIPWAVASMAVLSANPVES